MSASVPSRLRPAALVIALVAVAFVSACSSGGAGKATAATGGGVTMPPRGLITPPPTAAAPSGTGAALSTDTVAVTTLSTSLGRVLVDGRTGRTFYAYRGDGHDAPRCTGACAKVWTPVTGSQIGVAGGLDYRPGEFKLVARPDGGAKQLSVNGHPLYRYTGDQLAGQIRGQRVQGRWFVLGPGGQLITHS